MLVVVEQRDAVDVLDRHNRLGEVSARPCGLGARLRLGGVRVDVFTGEAFDGGDQVCADALRGDVEVVCRGGVGEHRATVAAHGHARHGLDAAGDDEVVPARCDLLGREVGGFEAGGAEAVDLGARHGVRQSCHEGGGTRDDRTLLADGGNHTEDHVVDVGGIHVREADLEFVDEADDEVDGLHAVQRALTLLATRRTNGLVDVCISHAEVSFQMNCDVRGRSPR